MDSLEGKTAVITGAASGMGRAMALRFASAGMNVAAADIDTDRLGAVVDEVKALGVEAIGVRTDVSVRADSFALLDATIDAFGQANVVCLNAGVTGSVGRSWTLTERDWEWSLGILLNGVVFGVQAFVPHLIEHGDGHVVTTASIAGHVSSPFSAPYGVAKHGVATMSESLLFELQLEGSTVGVTCLCPGFVNTNIVDAAKARSGDEVGSNKDEAGEKWLKMAGRALDAGLDPEVVGNQVHDAVLANQFWLFTDTAWDDAIATRAEEIGTRQPPTIGMATRH